MTNLDFVVAADCCFGLWLLLVSSVFVLIGVTSVETCILWLVWGFACFVLLLDYDFVGLSASCWVFVGGCLRALL